MKFSTTAIHRSQAPEKEYGSVIVPIYQTTTYAQTAPGEMIEGPLGAYDYSRSGNPTKTVLEDVLAGLEGGAHGFVFASGMGALTTLTMALLGAGDHVILGDDVYGGTFRLFDKTLKRFGVSVSYVDMTKPENVAAAITDDTVMVYYETPTNPMLKLADIQAISDIAQAHDIISVVDNTFASPYLQQPLALGADIVLHSTTKYIGGHSDITGGALITNKGVYADKIGFHQNSLGATADPLISWLTLRSVKTLAVRMDRHVKNAQAIAAFLDSHNRVEEVIYPGLPSHKQYDLARNQMSAPGGMISLRVKGDTGRFLDKLQYFTLAESLGGVESLVEVPAVMTHASLNEEDRQKLGITDNLVRLSVGIEDMEDLMADLDEALV